ncbi:hypothetical protein [Spirillospora sp. CA-128828]|uniref:hypothetical protein n=1 Tax=Spirillospora sp. CA-128828 TaxID=3240033 RepID=UPI003D8D3FE8
MEQPLLERHEAIYALSKMGLRSSNVSVAADLLLGLIATAQAKATRDPAYAVVFQNRLSLGMQGVLLIQGGISVDDAELVLIRRPIMGTIYRVRIVFGDE